MSEFKEVEDALLATAAAHAAARVADEHVLRAHATKLARAYKPTLEHESAWTVPRLASDLIARAVSALLYWLCARQGHSCADRRPRLVQPVGLGAARLNELCGLKSEVRSEAWRPAGASTGALFDAALPAVSPAVVTATSERAAARAPATPWRAPRGNVYPGPLFSTPAVDARVSQVGAAAAKYASVPARVRGAGDTLGRPAWRATTVTSTKPLNAIVSDTTVTWETRKAIEAARLQRFLAAAHGS